MANASDFVDLASLMIAWTQLDRDAALVSTFATRGAVTSSLAASPPPLSSWACRTCVVANEADVIILDT